MDDTGDWLSSEGFQIRTALHALEDAGGLVAEATEALARVAGYPDELSRLNRLYELLRRQRQRLDEKYVDGVRR